LGMNAVFLYVRGHVVCLGQHHDTFLYNACWKL
jgi:hypothetical protein